MLTINVIPYNPDWPKHFEVIAHGLDTALSDFLPQSAYRIEHVGSTSIPGLAAKPIIDIDIIVPAWAVMEATMALTSNGYTYAYEPNGIDRMVFRWNKHKLDSGASKPTEDGEPRRAVYLNKEDGVALLNHMIVRKALRNDDALRDEYGAVKLALVGEHESIGHYGGKKNDVLSKILKTHATEEEYAKITARRGHKIDPEFKRLTAEANAS